jgi:hypothetical protein
MLARMRTLPALLASLILAVAPAVPAVAKGGKSGGKSSKKHKSSGDSSCGSGTWIAFPILGGTVLVTRRRKRGMAS